MYLGHRHFKKVWVFLISTVACVHSVLAQSPASIAGRTLHLSISSGSFPFADFGNYRFLPSATDNWYAIVPTTANIAASTGIYTYSKTGTSTANLVVTDSVTGTSTVACTFNSSTTGTYVMTNPFAPGSRQVGTFQLFDGQAPDNISGMIFTVNVTSGDYPLASYGAYRFLTDPSSNTYEVEGIFNVPDSTGTYAYIKNSDSTALLSVNDSAVGSGSSQQLSFESADSGTIVWRLNDGSGYQTAVFSMTRSVIPPSILTPPENQSVVLGQTVFFYVFASGSSPLTYQWIKNGVSMDGETEAVLMLDSVGIYDAGSYSVRISNSAGAITSEPAVLSIAAPLSVTIDPPLSTIGIGETLTLTASASGSGPFSYQWRFNGTDIPTAISSTLTFNNAQPDQSGSYTVRVANSAGFATSTPAKVVIWQPASKKPFIGKISKYRTKIILMINDAQLSVRYRVQTSPNMSRWFDVTSVIANEPSFSITNSAASSEAGFYRIISP